MNRHLVTIAELRGQLRLANIDALNNEAEIGELRAENEKLADVAHAAAVYVVHAPNQTDPLDSTEYWDLVRMLEILDGSEIGRES